MTSEDRAWTAHGSVSGPSGAILRRVREPLVAMGDVAGLLALVAAFGSAACGGGASNVVPGPAAEPDSVSLPAWTAGRVEAEPRMEEGAGAGGAPVARIAELRTGVHDGWVRATVEMDDRGALPGYRVEYVDRPLRECGSGRQIRPAGEGWLELRMEPAAAHTEAGESTLESPEIRIGGPLLRRVYRTCDFEGVVTLVLALESPNPFRVFTLEDPARIVLDVQR